MGTRKGYQRSKENSSKAESMTRVRTKHTPQEKNHEQEKKQWRGEEETRHEAMTADSDRKNPKMLTKDKE